MDKPIRMWHVESLKLWYVPGRDYIGDENAGFDTAMTLLCEASLRHQDAVSLIDASLMSSEDLMDVYMYHASTCPWWRYEVRRVFGTNRSRGWLTATRVPLLSVRYREFDLPMVVPYIDWQVHPTRTYTILDVLRMWLRSEQQRLFGHEI